MQHTDTLRFRSGIQVYGVGMKIIRIVTVLLLLAATAFACGCLEPPVKEPTVTVRGIELDDVSLKAMTINTTVVIFNPNPIGARLNRVVFDVYYVDDGEHYLGHGERSNIDVKENGNTTVPIPVEIGNVPAIQAFGSLLRDSTLTVKVNGSAFVDVKVTEYELPFRQQRVFTTEDFGAFIPLSTLSVNGFNISTGLQRLGGFLSAVPGQ